MVNGLNLQWGDRQINVTGVIGALSLVSLLLGVALGWLVWTVGTDHRSMAVSFAAVREERSKQFTEIVRGQKEMEQKFQRVLDEWLWMMVLTPEERTALRHRMEQPERFRRQ